MTREDSVAHAEQTPVRREGLPLLRVVRCGITGVLMGLANLVPGVSGGTMVLIMGLYDEFIACVADATRFRFSRRSVVFLCVLGGAAVLTVVSLARPVVRLVEADRGAMYALFIGMTLGGVPLLWRMLRPIRAASAITLVVGLALMLAVAAANARTGAPDEARKEAIKERAMLGEIKVETSYALDGVAGVLSMSAMVLPGISGAYMMLLLGRYEAILGAVALLKEYVTTMGKSGDLASLHVIIPVGIGAIVGLAGVTNLLKRLLRRHEKPTLGLLFGILLGSVVMLWPAGEIGSARDSVKAGVMLLVGFALTVGLSRVGSRPRTD